MKKVLSSLLVIGVVGATAVGLSSAFFSDTETSTDNTFVAGELDLKIDTLDNPPALVNVTDLKPGDDIFEEKILKIIDNPAFVWMHIKDLVDGQGTPTDSETNEENTDWGGPKSDIQNYLKYDLTVNTAPIIEFTDEILLPDAVSCWIPLGELPGNTDVTVIQSFHFDESVTDWAQGDTLTFTEEFYATQVRNNPGATPPVLDPPRSWSSDLKKCVSDLSSKHNLTFTCTSGCSGVYLHTINMGSPDVFGDFTGTGFYNPNPLYTWDVTGNTAGISFTADILYTGLGAGYTVNLIGTVDASGNVNGTAVSSSPQTFTFVIN